MARGVEWSFYSYERTIVFLLFCYALYAYGPNRVPKLLQNERGVLVNFTEPEVKIGGIPQPFFFGLATAPAHVEDQVRSCGESMTRRLWVSRNALRPAHSPQQSPKTIETSNHQWKEPHTLTPRLAANPQSQLDDAWLDFGKAGNVSAFLNQQRPEVRNLFWTQPEVEIDLAAQAGAQVRVELTESRPHRLPHQLPSCVLHGASASRCFLSLRASRRRPPPLPRLASAGVPHGRRLGPRRAHAPPRQPHL